MLMTIGFLFGAALCAPTFFAIGLFAGIDRRRERVRYARPSLRREVSR